MFVIRRPRNQRRLSNLEERLFHQEKTTQALIERAFEVCFVCVEMYNISVYFNLLKK